MSEIVTGVSGPEEALDENRFKRFRRIAFWVSLPFAVIHLLMAVFTVPQFSNLYRELGNDLPLASSIFVNLGRTGLLGPLVLAFDAGIFWAMNRLARRYGIWLLFTPLAAYVLMPSAFVILLYAPMFDIDRLIR